jgi:hypothetical protein
LGELGFVFGKPTPLVVEAVDLPTQFADGPIAANAFDLVEAALGVVGDFEEFGKMRKGDTVDEVVGGEWCWLSRRLRDLRIGRQCLPIFLLCELQERLER